jgi:probable H4MPT-linked C1 transfer pathway protein
VPRVLGLDVGGANLKAASADGTALCRPFALWKRPEALGDELRALLAELPPAGALAVTMTGELCDCFATKREGVLAILAAVGAAATGRPVRAWLTDGRLAPTDEARADPLKAAASNWHALATYAGRVGPKGPALLLDVGSTTTDIIPLLDGQPAPAGFTDTGRLRSGELVYTGARRTPVCALLSAGVAAELFATTLDVYLTLGDLPESPSTDTADGKPATQAHAHVRLARMLGGDAETVCPEVIAALARRAEGAQLTAMQAGLRMVLERLPGPPRTIILAGSGEFLARKLLAHAALACDVVSLRERLGPEVSAAACAYALAVLATERPDAWN